MAVLQVFECEEMNQLQAENHKVIVKNALVKLSVQMLLIGQFFTEGWSKINMDLRAPCLF